MAQRVPNNSGSAAVPGRGNGEELPPFRSHGRHPPLFAAVFFHRASPMMSKWEMGTGLNIIFLLTALGSASR